MLTRSLQARHDLAPCARSCPVIRPNLVPALDPALAQEDLGLTVELSFANRYYRLQSEQSAARSKAMLTGRGNGRKTQTVTESKRPPLVGSHELRVSNIELMSYLNPQRQHHIA